MGPRTARGYRAEQMNVQRMSFALVFAAAVLYGCGQQQLPVLASSSSANVTVPGGTELYVTLSSPIGSASFLGDKVSGTTTSAIIVGNRVVIPAGSTIQGHVSAIDPVTKGLELSFTEVTTPMGDSASMSGSLTPGVTAIAGRTKVLDAVVPAGAVLAITLDQPLTIAQHS
jgi:hypothetical protein